MRHLKPGFWAARPIGSLATSTISTVTGASASATGVCTPSGGSRAWALGRGAPGCAPYRPLTLTTPTRATSCSLPRCLARNPR